jgi:hypothetical protein
MAHHRPRALASSAAVAVVSLSAVTAQADPSPLGLSVSLERAAGVAFASARPTSSDTGFGATTFAIAGPAINPIALPRAAADALLPGGLTLGGAVALGTASVSDNPDSGASSSITGHAWLLSPRVGYLLHLAPPFDLWPRAGLTIAGAGLQEPDSQSCASTSIGAPGVPPTSTPTCTTHSGPSESLTFVAVSLDVAGAIRLTQTFNLLVGVAYDHVVSASGSSTSGSTGASSDLQAGGKYLGGQLWLGLGGYVL